MPWPVWKLDPGMSTSALLEIERVLGGALWDVIAPLLLAADVIVLRASERQYKKLEQGESGFASASKETSVGRTLVDNDRSLVGTRRFSKTTYCRKRMKQEMDRTANFSSS